MEQAVVIVQLPLHNIYLLLYRHHPLPLYNNRLARSSGSTDKKPVVQAIDYFKRRFRMKSGNAFGRTIISNAIYILAWWEK